MLYGWGPTEIADMTLAQIAAYIPPAEAQQARQNYHSFREAVRAVRMMSQGRT